jgi:transposase
VRRVWQQFREEGRDGPAYANCGRRPTLDEAGRRQLLEIAARRPDAFCHELAEEVEQRMGVKVTRQTIGQWLRQLGVTRKKSRSTPASRSVQT